MNPPKEAYPNGHKEGVCESAKYIIRLDGQNEKTGIMDANRYGYIFIAR